MKKGIVNAAVAAGPGSKVTLHVKGAEAGTALSELENLVKRKFDEEYESFRFSRRRR